MHTVLARVAAYHKSLGLRVGVYHVDPFWFSRTPNGGCEAGPVASNLTGSSFHFPPGSFHSNGLDMMLFLQAFAPTNVYQGNYSFSGQSVASTDALRFFRDRFAELSNTSRLAALTLDGLQDVWLSDDARFTAVAAQETYDKGLADSALEHLVPIRVDQQMPSDVLASVQYGARTVGRCTGDADPTAGSEEIRYQQLGANALLLRAMGVRPMVDVLWTTEAQSDPRWTKPCRPNVGKVCMVYDLHTRTQAHTHTLAHTPTPTQTPLHRHPS